MKIKFVLLYAVISLFFIPTWSSALVIYSFDGFSQPDTTIFSGTLLISNDSYEEGFIDDISDIKGFSFTISDPVLGSDTYAWDGNSGHWTGIVYTWDYLADAAMICYLTSPEYCEFGTDLDWGGLRSVLLNSKDGTLPYDQLQAETSIIMPDNPDMIFAYDPIAEPPLYASDALFYGHGTWSLSSVPEPSTLLLLGSGLLGLTAFRKKFRK